MAIAIQFGIGDDFKSQGLQGIPYQQGGGIIELLVATRLTAPQVVIVHARHVIVH